MTRFGVLLLAFCTQGWPEDLLVHLHDHAGVANAEKSKAISEAMRVLNEAGIRTRWTEQPPSKAWPFNPDRHPTDLFVRILNTESAGRLTPRGSALGFAQPVGSGHLRWLATVWGDRARQLAKGTEIEVGVLLGHMMAHEIGHLLLDVDAHSPSGIMKSPWHTGEMRLAREGRLLFGGAQPTRMAANVRARATDTMKMAATARLAAD